MRNLVIITPSYRLLEKGLEGWLRTLGYAESTVYNTPAQVRSFLYFLEQQQITELSQVDAGDIDHYFEFLSHRRNYRRGGSLSANYLVSHLNALKRFCRYLRETRRQNLEIGLSPAKPAVSHKTILAKQEIKALYDVTDDTITGVRDRAMLGIYYGCGLRRSEGIALDINDINTDKKLLYVRRAKNYRERYVPYGDGVKHDLNSWLSVRDEYLRYDGGQAFLLSQRGQRISGNALIKRIKVLSDRVGLDKEIGLHTLRHSIATHLLHQGMSLENVSRFLGHRSLENTQIYTHLKHEAL